MLEYHKLKHPPLCGKLQKQLNNDINIFQQELAAAKPFKEMYGPVTFRDNDAKTALDFLKQILHVEEEEISSKFAESTRHDIDVPALNNDGNASNSDKLILVIFPSRVVENNLLAKISRTSIMIGLTLIFEKFLS